MYESIIHNYDNYNMCMNVESRRERGKRVLFYVLLNYGQGTSRKNSRTA